MDRMNTVQAISEFMKKYGAAAQELQNKGIYLSTLLRKNTYSLEEVSKAAAEAYKKRTGKELFAQFHQSPQGAVEKISSLNPVERGVAERFQSLSLTSSSSAPIPYLPRQTEQMPSREAAGLLEKWIDHFKNEDIQNILRQAGLSPWSFIKDKEYLSPLELAEQLNRKCMEMGFAAPFARFPLSSNRNPQITEPVRSERNLPEPIQVDNQVLSTIVDYSSMQLLYYFLLNQQDIALILKFCQGNWGEKVDCIDFCNQEALASFLQTMGSDRNVESLKQDLLQEKARAEGAVHSSFSESESFPHAFLTNLSPLVKYSITEADANKLLQGFLEKYHFDQKNTFEKWQFIFINLPLFREYKNEFGYRLSTRAILAFIVPSPKKPSIFSTFSIAQLERRHGDLLRNAWSNPQSYSQWLQKMGIPNEDVSNLWVFTQHLLHPESSLWKVLFDYQGFHFLNRNREWVQYTHTQDPYMSVARKIANYYPILENLSLSHPRFATFVPLEIFAVILHNVSLAMPKALMKYQVKQPLSEVLDWMLSDVEVMDMRGCSQTPVDILRHVYIKHRSELLSYGFQWHVCSFGFGWDIAFTMFFFQKQLGEYLAELGLNTDLTAFLRALVRSSEFLNYERVTEGYYLS